MPSNHPQRVRRRDYLPPAFLVDRIAFEFDLDAERTDVQAELHVRPNPQSPGHQELVLDGEHLELVSIAVNGRALGAAEYRLDASRLVLAAPGGAFVVRLRNRIAPAANTALQGMYLSGQSLFTQCEAQGMRRITWMLDRPDVLARYTVRLRADPGRFPVLLSNGNLVEQGPLPDGRHFALWDDPFPKPSYLFAVVAGRFASRDARLRTCSGREVLLQIYADAADLPRLEWAAGCLERAIRWDEERFGRELDLERYMIVAAADFNMGAMENKGLNVFNSKYVLADPTVATDTDFGLIESIIGHEYFHNWSGNRVTCRDWFQLSLKEGLTVFRDQEFTRDLLAAQARSLGDDPDSARAIQRIDDVRALRAVQFPEDAGPMAHPVRPDSYLEISNFYTSTVYEKGAEVVRMIQTLIGVEDFRRGLDLYFARHDGEAATCEQFVAAMAEASGRELAQFLRWYSQSGTPRVVVNRTYDAAAKTLELHIAQYTPPTPDQPEKEPLLIPVAIGLVGAGGEALPVRFADEAPDRAATTRVIELGEISSAVRLVDVPPGTVPSLLRDFSAPVVLEHAYDEHELMLLARHDRDGFNRWEAVQKIALDALLHATDAIEAGEAVEVAPGLVQLAESILRDDGLSPALRERCLILPSEVIVTEQRAVVEPRAIRDARLVVRATLARALAPHWRRAYDALGDARAYSPDSAAAARRALRNLALSYLAAQGDAGGLALAQAQLDAADNLTDRIAALSAIVHSPGADKARVLLRMAREWQHEPLLMNKWLALQATAPAHPGEPPTLERVRALLRHPAYSERNPNCVSALVLGFCGGNPAEFHRADASGYAFWTEQVLRLDRLNPMVASRVARTLERWRRYPPGRSAAMKSALEQVAGEPALSRDVREIIDRTLAG